MLESPVTAIQISAQPVGHCCKETLDEKGRKDDVSGNDDVIVLLGFVSRI